MRKLEEMDWWPELVEKKDEYSLRELAEIFGATPGAINNALKRNGIKRQAAPPGPRSRRQGRDDAEVAEAPEAAAAATPEAAPAPKKTRKKGAGKKKGKTGARGPRAATFAKLEPYDDKLGVITDAEIADAAGVSVQTVARYRKSKGIKASRRRGGAVAVVEAPSPARGRSKIDKYKDLVGQVPDSEVAKLAGVKEASVVSYRRRHEIAAHQPAELAVAEPEAAAPEAAAPEAAAPEAAAPEAAAPEVAAPEVAAPEVAAPAPVAAAPVAAPPKAAPAAVAAPAASSSDARLAYRVTLGDRTVIVVAANVIDAATQASGTNESVSLIELIGEVLG